MPSLIVQRVPITVKPSCVCIYYNSWHERKKNTNSKKKRKWKSEKPLEVRKRAKDPIRGEPPQITTKQKQQRIYKIKIGIKKLKLQFRVKI